MLNENAGLEIRTHGGKHLTEITKKLQGGESAADVPLKDALGRRCRASYDAAHTLRLDCSSAH